MQFLDFSQAGSSRGHNSFEETKSSVDKENIQQDNNSRLPLTSLSLFHSIWSPLGSSSSNFSPQPLVSSLRSHSGFPFEHHREPNGSTATSSSSASSSGNGEFGSGEFGSLWSFNNHFWNTKTENFVTSANGHAKRGSTSSVVNIENANGAAEYCDLVQSIAIDTNHYNSSEVEQIRSEFENNGRDSDFHFEDADTEAFNPSTFSPPKVKLDDASKYMNGLKGFQREDLMTPNRPVVSKKKFKPHKKSLSDFCVFCKNNGAPESVYKTHTVKDAKGRALCPKLRIYKCPICGVDGDDAHTKKYCPMKPIVTEADTAKTY